MLIAPIFHRPCGALENAMQLANYMHVLYAIPSNKMYIIPETKLRALLNNILTEPEVKTSFSISTRSDLSLIRKETIKKKTISLIDG